MIFLIALWVVCLMIQVCGIIEDDWHLVMLGGLGAMIVGFPIVLLTI